MNRTDRLMAILLNLQATGELRAADLAERFEVSVRTIYRDLEALSEGGVPLIATPGRGYRLLEGYFLPPLTFSGPEAGLLVLGGEYIRSRVDTDLSRTVEEALRKLTSVLPAEQRDRVEEWRRELVFPRSRRTDEGYLGTIRGALEEQRVVRMRYHAFRRPAPELRDVEPISLVFMAEAWHLVAYCRTRQAPRLFRLNRIDELDVLRERFTLDERHVLHNDRFDPPAEIPEARVRFDTSVERWVRERQPFTFVREERDLWGAVFVYAVRDERSFLAWLLSWGRMAELIEPPDLRARLANEAFAIFSRHAAATDTTLSGALAHAGVEA